MRNTFNPIRDFDSAPDSMLLDIASASAISTRSRSSLYRDAKAGRLHMVKIGNSTRIRVGELRRMIQA